jgi:hypothetical protein
MPPLQAYPPGRSQPNNNYPLPQPPSYNGHPHGPAFHLPRRDDDQDSDAHSVTTSSTHRLVGAPYAYDQSTGNFSFFY